jgi:glycosyltransferase involved in cell wall biosynthesis
VRIVHVIAEMGSGGAEALVEDLARHRLGLGDAVTVASAGGRRAEALATEGARLVPVALHRRSAWKAVLGAAGAARSLRGQADVVHAHNVGAALVAHLAARWPRRRPPLVVTVHGLPAADYPRAAGLLRRTADLVVAVSETEREKLVAGGLPSDRVRVVDNAVAQPAPYDRARARQELGLDPDVPVALWVARLAPPKRPDLLVEAWRAVPEPAVLLVAGGGPLAVPEAERVRVLGERSDVSRLLAAADVYCLASDSEGMPMAVLEAMSAGVPVVATGVGGLVAGCTGAARLVPPGDAGALAAALTELLASPSRRAELAAAGRERVAERFSVAAMRGAYDAVYAALSVR